MTVAKRETAANRSKSPQPITDAQREAGRANLAKGRATKAAIRAKAAEEDRMSAQDRWAMLLSGTLTVRDLDDQEIRKMRVRSADGTFNGPGKQRLPSHLAQQFLNEAMRRANDKIRTAVPEAVKILVEIAKDPDAKHADRLKAISMLMDRGMGRVPETVRIESGDHPWEALLTDAVGVDRDVADTSGEAIN